MRTKLAFRSLRSDNASSSDSLWSASHNPCAAASTLDRSRGVRIVDTGVRWELRFESDGMISPSMCNCDALPCYLTCKNASECFATADEEHTLSSFVIFQRAISRTVAHSIQYYSRKVRAPVDRLPGNTWARIARAVRDGQCHRKETAIFGWQG